MSRGVSPVTVGQRPTDSRKAKRMKQSTTSMWTEPVVLNEKSGEQPQCRATPLDAPQPQWLQWMAPTRGWYPGSKAAGGAAKPKAPKGWRSQPKVPQQPQMRNCSEMESPFAFAEELCDMTQLCTRRPGHSAFPQPGPHGGGGTQAANPANPLAGVALGVPTGAPPNPHWFQGLPPFPPVWLGGRPAFATQQQQPFATQQQSAFATQQQQPFTTQQQQPFATQQQQPFATQQSAFTACNGGQTRVSSVSSFPSDSSFHSLSPERYPMPPNAPPPVPVHFPSPPRAQPRDLGGFPERGNDSGHADESVLSLLVDDVMRDGSMDGLDPLMQAVVMGEEVDDDVASFELTHHPHPQPQPQTASDDAVRAAMLALAKAKRQKAMELMAEAKAHEDAMMLAFHGLV